MNNFYSILMLYVYAIPIALKLVFCSSSALSKGEPKDQNILIEQLTQNLGQTWLTCTKCDLFDPDDPCDPTRFQPW